jgi:hypothetical protein
MRAGQRPSSASREHVVASGAGEQVRLDFKALVLAIAIELVLVVLAMFGGPHGALGGWPWVLQLPGILVLLLIPGEGGFAWRAVAMIAIQLTLWYCICVVIGLRLHRISAHPATRGSAKEQDTP